MTGQDTGLRTQGEIGVGSDGVGVVQRQETILALLGNPAIIAERVRLPFMPEFPYMVGQMVGLLPLDLYIPSLKVAVSWLPSFSDTMDFIPGNSMTGKPPMKRGQWSKLEAERRFATLAKEGVLHLSIHPETILNEAWLADQRKRFDEVKENPDAVVAMLAQQTRAASGEPDIGIRTPSATLAF